MTERRALITGASGLLGRAVMTVFRSMNWDVCGLAFSRAGEDLVRVDICNSTEVEQIFETFKPKVVIHCAAQRFPDKVDKDVDGTIKLNVDATKHLASLAASIGIPMLYISSDYVFDGTKPPYTENDSPNPLNTYGKTKLLGEQVTLEASQGHLVLRIPVLFGSVQFLEESAVTVLLNTLLRKDNVFMSDYEIRCPSHVDDIATVCLKLLELKLVKPDEVRGIFHWGGEECMTKYGMVRTISDLFNLPMDHIKPDPNPSPGAPRPYNAQLSNAKLQSLGIGKHTPFRDAIYVALKPWVEKQQF